MRFRWFLLSIFVVIWSVPFISVKQSSYAQTDTLSLVYVDLEDTVTLYNQADDRYQALIPRDLARAYTYQMYLSPSGQQVAIYVYSFEREAMRRGDNSTRQYMLYLFSLPSGEEIFARNLLNADYVFPPANGAEASSQSEELPYALDEIHWSPNGNFLVWVEGVAQGDATLWLWDSSDNGVTALTDEAGYPDQVHWSPIGTQLIYTGVDQFGGGADLIKNGGYLLTLDDQSSVKLDLGIQADRFWILDWVNDSAFLWSLYDPDTGAAGIFTYDLTTQTTTEILNADYKISIPVWDMSSQTIAFAVPDLSYAEIPSVKLSPGAYILENLSGEPIQLSNANNLFGVQMVVAGYLAIGNDLVIRLSDRTEFATNEMRWPHYSPDGKYALGEREAKTVLRELSTTNETTISGLFFVEGEWLDDTSFIAKVGAYGSVIGYGVVGGPFTDLVEDAGNGPFVGARP